MDRRYNCHYNSQRIKCSRSNQCGNQCGNLGNQCGNLGNQVIPNNTSGPGQWWDSVLTPPLSATSSQSGSSCSRFIEKHTAPCTDGCNKLLTTSQIPHENRFVWDRTPYDKLCYDTRNHPGNEHRCHRHPGDMGPHHGEPVSRYPAPCCHQAEYEIYTRHHCCRPAQPPPKPCCSHAKPATCDCGSERVYNSARLKKQQICTCKNCTRSPSPLLLSTPTQIIQSSARNLVPLTFNSPESPAPAQLYFPINYSTVSGRTRAFSCEAVLSSSSNNKSSGSPQPDTKNAVTSPTMPAQVQSDQISSTTPTEDEDKTSELDTAYRTSNTVNRATSPFMVKTATQVQQIPNDPAVKSLVKSVVMFNDVEYQVPTKIIRRSKSQELVQEEKENIYWEIEDTPLKPPQQTCYSFFCTPRRKEQRNVSADSVGSITPLLKCKKSGGFFKLGRSSKSKHSTCLNGKVLRGVMSRKTADNISSGQPGVSRVKIFNASSERYEAAKGRHTVQIPSNVTETNQAHGSTQKEGDKVKASGKQSKQSALGRLFGKRKSEGGLRWMINPEYYIVRDGSGGPVDYILPDDTFDTVEL
ncbi:hypothetical protein ACHWQZ_G007654 [Mnemiopsis leidyi]